MFCNLKETNLILTFTCAAVCVVERACAGVVLLYRGIEGWVRSQVKPSDLFQAETLPPVPILYFYPQVLDSNCLLNVLIDKRELFIFRLSACTKRVHTVHTQIPTSVFVNGDEHVRDRPLTHSGSLFVFLRVVSEKHSASIFLSFTFTHTHLYTAHPQSSSFPPRNFNYL